MTVRKALVTISVAAAIGGAGLAGCGGGSYSDECKENARQAGYEPGSDDYNKEAELCEDTKKKLENGDF